MFVQGPQIIRQRSDSEDGSDEEGPEDVLQVNSRQESWLDIFTYLPQKNVVVNFRLLNLNVND